jgi:hypothetical protein
MVGRLVGVWVGIFTVGVAVGCPIVGVIWTSVGVKVRVGVVGISVVSGPG